MERSAHELGALVLELADELGIARSRVADELLVDPDRAAAALAIALHAPGVYDRAPLALTLFRDRRSSVAALELEADALAPGLLLADTAPPELTLDTLELAWSREGTWVGHLLCRMVAAALERAGGFQELQRQMYSGKDLA